eukprot:g18282.t1
MHPPRPIAVSWVAVAWFLSALMLYWQLLRPAARLARKMSMKLERDKMRVKGIGMDLKKGFEGMSESEHHPKYNRSRVALVSLFGLWLCTILILLAWSLGGVHDSDFMLAILKFGPLGYIHVFLSGVVLARVFVLLVCVDAATGDTPDAETEDFELSTGQLPWILEFGSCLALVIYVLIVMLRLDPWKATGFYAFCHNGGLGDWSGGILPIMCLLLLACATEEDAMVPLLTSRVGKMLGRISYCQYLVQTNLEQAVRPWLDLAVQHGIGLWVGLPVYLLTLVFTAYVFEALASTTFRAQWAPFEARTPPRGRAEQRKPVESPPVAAFPPPRCVGVRVPRGTPRFAPASRPVDADRVDTACQLGRQCRDLSELCKEAAAAEVATLIQRVASSGSDRSGAAREVAQLLLSDDASARAAPAAPPYLRRWHLLRRGRRQLRALRQARRVLALRDELRLMAAWGAWRRRTEVRRMVRSMDCETRVSLQSPRRERERELPQHEEKKLEEKRMLTQVLLHWSLVTFRASRVRQAEWNRRRMRPGLLAVLGRGEAAYRLVLLFASLHAWSEHAAAEPKPLWPGGVPQVLAQTRPAPPATPPSAPRPRLRLCRAAQLSCFFGAWSRLVFQQRAQLAQQRSAQDRAELLRVQMRFALSRELCAERCRSRRLLASCLKGWTKARKEHPSRVLSAAQSGTRQCDVLEEMRRDHLGRMALAVAGGARTPAVACGLPLACEGTAGQGGCHRSHGFETVASGDAGQKPRNSNSNGPFACAKTFWKRLRRPVLRSTPKRLRFFVLGGPVGRRRLGGFRRLQSLCRGFRERDAARSANLVELAVVEETNASILDAAREALLRHFGFGALRAFQAEAIAAWTEGRDALISMGTGSGKSLCFQLPALLKPSTLVISPLISLMQAWVRTLRQRQIHAVYCGSGGASIRELREGVPPRGGVQVIYMCPEFALTHLSELALLMLGTAYREGQQPIWSRDIPIPLALPWEDFREIFGLHGDSSARAARSVDNTSINCMSSSIIYVPTRAKSEELAQWLEAQGVRAEPYHAGLSLQARERLHTAFLLDEVQVVVATVAFGMGIDKPSIRRVVHYGGVKSIEDFVQQTGRAGRDGEEAETVAFTRPSSDAQEIKG